jgi:hypothetical protein
VNRRSFLCAAAGLPLVSANGATRLLEIPADVLEDKIRGGFLGQVLGDLNGLQYEMKYIAAPGDVQEYTPSLPEGAWTDDDTDVEWPYILEMQRSGVLRLPYSQIAGLWKRHINRRIWCSHLFLRQLLDIGIEPPLTGRREINPWADFNLSGQFVAESWGLISPGMPQTAGRIGIHYTQVSIDGEAIQATQMITAMIAAAFFTNDMEKILDAGAAALDRKSVMSQIVADVRRWGREYPNDWRATRRLTKEKYCKYGGQDMRDRNGVWLNGGSTIAALIYGDGGFVQTIRSAFNFGWDADNNAAACGAILGVIKGRRWIASQGWNIQDRYRNTSRDNVPEDETISRYAGRLVALAHRNILERGGSRALSNGMAVFRIAAEEPANIEPLRDPERGRLSLRSQLQTEVERGIAGKDVLQQARAAYLAICLDLAPGLKQRQPEQWSRAIHSLAGYPRVLQAIFHEAPFPAGDNLRERALAAGLEKPASEIQLAR